MASATPLVNELFSKWADALDQDQTTGELLKKAHVPIRTRDIVPTPTFSRPLSSSSTTAAAPKNRWTARSPG